MQVVWTKPKPPENLKVAQVGEKSFNISWDALNTEIDESRVLYMLEVEELMIPEPQKESCNQSSTFPVMHLPKECRYNVTKRETFQTLQTI